MKLLLIRHGETIENREGIFQGWNPGKLSRLGERQAKLLGKRLKDVKIDLILTSDLRRTYDTAKEISKYHKNIKLIKDKLLRERGLGDFQGKKRGEVDWREFNGESFLEVYARMKLFYKKILKKYKKETILIVGHGASGNILRLIIQKGNIKNRKRFKKLQNTFVTEYIIDKKGNSKLKYLNCRRHLEE